ncbi:MAG TPA: diguanylate cyclase, partial [Spirochaetia bacterium]|nr:diguanylate cyclase [Spirochaetia bacterium]
LLLHTAEILLRSRRGADKVGRVSGAGFVLLLPETSGDEARRAVATLKADLAHLSLPTLGSTPLVKFRIDLLSLPEEASRLANALGLTDLEALYDEFPPPGKDRRWAVDLKRRVPELVINLCRERP